MLAQIEGLCLIPPTPRVSSEVVLSSCGVSQRGYGSVPCKPTQSTLAETVLGGAGVRYRHRGTPLAPLKWQAQSVLISGSWAVTDRQLWFCQLIETRAMLKLIILPGAAPLCGVTRSCSTHLHRSPIPRFGQELGRDRPPGSANAGAETSRVWLFAFPQPWGPGAVGQCGAGASVWYIMGLLTPQRWE